MMNAQPFPLRLDEQIRRDVIAALAEDIGSGDLTAALIDDNTMGQAIVVARQPAIICGTAWFDACFSNLGDTIEIQWQVKDGDAVDANTTLCTINGPASRLLAGERSALNFLQLLSGIATRTRQFVDAVKGTPAQIVDTRKTIPGLRIAQKYAVYCGGGTNHRMGLHDAILIKENHIMAAGSITAAMQKAKSIAADNSDRCKFIEVEVENLTELEEALAAGATIILLDNFDIPDLHQAVKRTNNRATLEASGGINLDTVAAIANTGVNRISIGSLTKDVSALDLSMRFTSQLHSWL